MRFGIFDHMDSNGLTPQDYFEARLKLTEAYDKHGFYSYHIAEHHSTPLGLSPSPSVFLAAVAQRTKRLRFGPLVYALPFYNPLRLVEEICMLDHMSGGRLDVGFGRGASPIEMEYYGFTAEQAQAMYAEGLRVVQQALQSSTLNFEGDIYQFRDVPIQLPPLQSPHPPIWYGAHSVDSSERAARQGLNIINNDSPVRAQAVFARYRAVSAENQTNSNITDRALMGLVRFIVVAETDEAALRIARRAYPQWHANFTHLYRLKGRAPMLGERASTFDDLRDIEGKGVAGSPATVAAYLLAQLRLVGANYLVGQFAFGDMTTSETLQSIDLFASHVAPTLRQALSSESLQTQAVQA